MNIETLFEDNYLLAVDKPSGLVTHATLDKSRENLYDLLKNKYGDDLALHHRLDKETSGVILFSKDQKIRSSFDLMFKEHHFTKTYLAVVERSKKDLEKNFVVDNFLKEEKIKGIMQSISVMSGGKRAITSFKILKETSDYLLIEAIPKTGRMHQIRSHLKTAGIPIIGDLLYGSTKKSVELHLHAYSLSFIHPITKNEINIESLYPKRFIISR